MQPAGADTVRGASDPALLGIRGDTTQLTPKQVYAVVYTSGTLIPNGATGDVPSKSTCTPFAEMVVAATSSIGRS